MKESRFQGRKRVVMMNENNIFTAINDQLRWKKRRIRRTIQAPLWRNSSQALSFHEEKSVHMIGGYQGPEGNAQKADKKTTGKRLGEFLS